MTARDAWRQCYRRARVIAATGPRFFHILAIAGDDAAAAGFGSIRFRVTGRRVELARRQPWRKVTA
jgi:hypothetical protein